jgi:hypothetical protein
MDKYFFRLTTLFLLVGFLAPYPSQTWASETEVFSQQLDGGRPGDLFEGISASNPKLYRFLNGQALNRWRSSSDEGWLKLHHWAMQSDLALHSSTDSEAISSKSFTFLGRIYAKSTDTLTVLIKSFRVIESGVTIDYRARPDALNTVFVNFLGVLMSSVHDLILQTPSIAAVEFYGDNVINASLLKVLQDLGFQSAPKPGSSGHNAILFLRVKNR